MRLRGQQALGFLGLSAPWTGLWISSGCGWNPLGAEQRSPTFLPLEENLGCAVMGILLSQLPTARKREPRREPGHHQVGAFGGVLAVV